MTTTVRASSSAHLAVLLPYQLGYHPRSSVVLVALHGKRIGMVQRHDLVQGEEVCAGLARRSVEMVVREQAGALLLVSYEDEEGESAPLRQALARAAREADVEVGDQIVVRGGRWYSTQGGAPPQGLPMPRPEDVPGVAAFVGAGVAPFASREALVADVIPPRDPARAREVGVHLAGLGRAPGTGTFGGGPTRPRTAWHEDPVATIRSWQRLLDPRQEAVPVAELSDDELARIVASLDDVHLRDALMAVLAPGTLPLDTLPALAVGDALVASARCAWTCFADELDDDPGGAAEPLGDVAHDELLGVRGRLVEVTRYVPEESTPHLLSLIAHLAWFVGDGTVTGVCLEQALAIDPGHRLAGLMMQLLSAGVRPWTVDDAA